MFDPQERTFIKLSVFSHFFNKPFIKSLQIVLSISLLLGLSLMLTPSVQAQDCKDQSNAQPNGTFNLTFLGIAPAGGGKMTYSYKLRWNGTGNGLSHIVIGLCSEITQANLDSFSVTSTPASGPWGCSGTAPQGAPCIQTDNPTGDFYGIKFSPLSPGATSVPPNTDIFITFTLKPAGSVVGFSLSEQGWRLKAGGGFSTGAICGPDCSTIPSAARIKKGSATRYNDGTIGIQWTTSQESRNLGFNVYRDENGQLAKLNAELIAGSALLAGNARLAAGNKYSFWDKGASNDAKYWIEDIDVDNGSSWRGPYFLSQSNESAPAQVQATMISQLGQSQAVVDSSRPVDFAAGNLALSASRVEQSEFAKIQGQLASLDGIKISVRKTGWYRISLNDLMVAGLNTDINFKKLQLFTGGQEQPMLVSLAKNGSIDSSSAIEFYGEALDNDSTDTRTYWLVAGKKVGLRVAQINAPGSSSTNRNFTQTIERRDRSIYYSALLNGDAENFFGAVVSQSGVDQTLNLPHLDSGAAQEAVLEINLQGVTQIAHGVQVQVNGSNIGNFTFTSQLQGTAKMRVPHALLREGINTVRLASQNGQGDISLVNAIRLSYQHTFAADDNVLQLTANGGEQVRISGFTSKAIRVFDVTSPSNVQELIGKIDETNAAAVTFTAQGNGQRRLLAITDEKALTPAKLAANQASNLKDSTNAADLVMITTQELMPAIKALKQARQEEGYRVALVDIEDIYDEFSAGNKSVSAIKDFLAHARTSWRVAPRFVLLAGDASYDRKNYLGFGDNDRVPSKSVDATFIEAASDGWFADFDNDGVPEMAIGRLPVRTAEELAIVVDKLIKFKANKTADAVVLISGKNDGYNFEQASNSLKDVLPSELKIQEVKRGESDTETAIAKTKEAISKGVKVLNYYGHGSINLVQDNILTSEDAAETNNESLPLMVMMTCLTGYFQDASLDSIAESWLKVRHGAIAVWASSGLTIPTGQTRMAQEFYKQIFRQKASLTLGEAAMKAKTVTSDADVRKTWNLFGDPTMRIR
jgi:hypothetical protein